jgi:hypothetical protein
VRLHQLFFVVISALFGVTVAHASSIPPGGTFNVDLDNPNQSGCTNPSGCGGWITDGTPDSFTDVANPAIPSFISEGSFTCLESKKWFWWRWDHDDNDCKGDPDIGVKGSGDPLEFPQQGFTADSAGGGTFPFVNDYNGGTLNSIGFIAPLNPGEDYSCYSTIFTNCGFAVIDPKGGLEIEALFYNSTPEPSEYLFLLVAGAAIPVARRLRSRRRSA